MAMKNLLGCLVVVPAAAIGMSFAAPAAAAPTNCQTIGATTVCGQGTVRGGGQAAPQPSSPSMYGGGCTTPYGTYQAC
jgi:hypothetical protein